MIETTIRIQRTRTLRDRLRGDEFEAVRRFPGGREIPLAKGKTRTRVFKRAQQVLRPQTSPTAGGTFTDANAPEPAWKQSIDIVQR